MGGAGSDYPFDPHILDLFDWGDTAPAERMEKVREAVDRLPLKYRTVVDAVFWEGISQRALARRLGVDKDEVRKRLRDACQRLGKDPQMQAEDRMGSLSATRRSGVVQMQIPFILESAN